MSNVYTKILDELIHNHELYHFTPMNQISRKDGERESLNNVFLAMEKLNISIVDIIDWI